MTSLKHKHLSISILLCAQFFGFSLPNLHILRIVIRSSVIMDAEAVRALETRILLVLLLTVITELLHRSGQATVGQATSAAQRVVESPGTPPIDPLCSCPCDTDGCSHICCERGHNTHTVHRCAQHRAAHPGLSLKRKR